MTKPRASVLIVEDERIVAKDLQEELASVGYDAYAIAGSADEAIAAASARCPDVVLMDIRIGGALDGIETAKLLRDRFGVALVYLTAHADEATVERAALTEPHGYLLKPVRASELRGAIEVALQKHAQERRMLERERWLASTLHALGDGWPELGAAAVARAPGAGTIDADAQRAIARRLEVTDRLASIGTLAAGVAHEVNNPLSVVVANASYVADELARVRAELGPDAALDEAITAQAELLGAADRIARLVGDLRDFTRPAATDGDPRADVAAAIARAVRTTAAALRDRARVVSDLAAMPRAPVDEARLAQVLVNLLVNASHALATGGPAQHVVHVRGRTGADGWIEIEVEDSGTGIAPEHLPHVFQPFFTTKPVGVGTGLGLAVCHGIVTSLGGTIRATSTLGQGTTIALRLPPAAAVERGALRPGTRVRVLVIDDEEAVLRALGRMLRDHEVVVARGGSEALAQLEVGSPFDVIFTDIAMPDMTGIELFERLRATRPDDARRLVFLTGGAVTSDTRDFLESVGNNHVEKPVRGHTLHELIARVMAGAPA